MFFCLLPTIYRVDGLMISWNANKCWKNFLKSWETGKRMKTFLTCFSRIDRLTLTVWIFKRGVAPSNTKTGRMRWKRSLRILFIVPIRWAFLTILPSSSRIACVKTSCVLWESAFMITQSSSCCVRIQTLTNWVIQIEASTATTFPSRVSIDTLHHYAKFRILGFGYWKLYLLIPPSTWCKKLPKTFDAHLVFPFRTRL